MKLKANLELFMEINDLGIELASLASSVRLLAGIAQNDMDISEEQLEEFLDRLESLDDKVGVYYLKHTHLTNKLAKFLNRLKDK